MIWILKGNLINYNRIDIDPKPIMSGCVCIYSSLYLYKNAQQVHIPMHIIHKTLNKLDGFAWLLVLGTQGLKWFDVNMRSKEVYTEVSDPIPVWWLSFDTDLVWISIGWNIKARENPSCSRRPPTQSPAYRHILVYTYIYI